jgi:hypothetical protein
MESSAELIVHAAARHLAQRKQHHVAGLGIFRPYVIAQQKIEHRRPWKLRSAAEAAEARVKATPENREAAIQRRCVENHSPMCGLDRDVLLQLFDDAHRGLGDLLAIAPPS